MSRAKREQTAPRIVGRLPAQSGEVCNVSRRRPCRAAAGNPYGCQPYNQFVQYADYALQCRPELSDSCFTNWVVNPLASPNSISVLSM